MKTSEHIKKSLDAADANELDEAILFACLAIDGTAKKLYGNKMLAGNRIRKFITDNIDIIELMHGGLDLKNTIFPFENYKGQLGIKFEDIIYEKFRCTLAHGDELPDGFGINIKLDKDIDGFEVNMKNRAMTLPTSAIYALGFPCVLSHANKDQQIGNKNYYYRDSINIFVVDDWWGKLDEARKVMPFDKQIKLKLDFSNYMPK